MNDFELYVFRRAIDRFGDEAQVGQCIEELAELIQALCKYRRYGRENWPESARENLYEEFADVSIMLDQMALIFGFDKSVRQEKVIRLARFLRETEAE